MPGRLEDRLDSLGGRLRERVVERRVGGRLRALSLGQLGDVVRPDLTLLVGRRLLREEEVLEAAIEQLRRAAGRLDVEHSVALGHRGRRQVQQRGEGPKQKVHLVAADQGVVVGHDRVLVALVVLDDHLHRAPVDEAALLVDHCLPDLVALLCRLAGLRELSGQRQRGADLDRLTTGFSALRLRPRRRRHRHRSRPLREWPRPAVRDRANEASACALLRLLGSPANVCCNRVQPIAAPRCLSSRSPSPPAAAEPGRRRPGSRCRTPPPTTPRRTPPQPPRPQPGPNR